ncbi:MAG TPA: hypothetical protein VM890_01355, partial [Longimicrobium sp.]|nr:hypothetical protein [Longimicrobium sp.]
SAFADCSLSIRVDLDNLATEITSRTFPRLPPRNFGIVREGGLRVVAARISNPVIPIRCFPIR